MIRVSELKTELASISRPGIARLFAWFVIACIVLGSGFLGNKGYYAVIAAVYVVIGLSLNLLVGYLGQLSLGHQGFVGAGALFTALTLTRWELPFPVAIIVGALIGAALALLVGFAALRIRGLYLSLVTLVFGLVLQSSLFQISSLTGGGGGQPANRPPVILGTGRYYLVCVAVVCVLLYCDSNLLRSKVGRAILFIRDDERAAAAFGINVVGYKLLAFVLSGAVAGLGGALFAFAYQQFNGNDFSFPLALTFLLMTVVGGAGSRWGVVVGAVLFALLHSALVAFPLFKALAGVFGQPVHNNILQFGADLIASVLLIFTVVRHPGGLSHSVDHFVKWLRGPIRTRPESAATHEVGR